jgi:HEPN domain-containing protein
MMTSGNKGQFLTERAERFYSLGKRLLEEETLDLAAFHFQQAAELWLKYQLFEELGDYPKTHSLKALIGDLPAVSNLESELKSLFDQRIDVISNLQNAYITSRYLPGDFRQKEVKNMQELVTELKHLLQSNE